MKKMDKIEENCNVEEIDWPPTTKTNDEMYQATGYNGGNDDGQRSKLVVFVGKIVIFMTIVSFLFVGILINLIQLVLLLTSKLSDEQRWRSLHKKINGYLVYILFSPPICLLYYWSRIELNIELDDMKLIEDTKNSTLGIMIPNHSYELDYMVCFVLSDQLGNIGAYKSMSKDELKYLPVIGWALWMSDIIFVKRNWMQDKLDIGKKLDNLFDYEQALLGVFAEGTRWTPEKHQASIEFAVSRGIKPLKYHLIPRSRGFNYTVRHCLQHIAQNGGFEERPFKLYNLQIILPDSPNFRDFIEGRQLRADVYCEEIPLSQEIRNEVLKSKDEDDCNQLTQLMHDVFRRKDELVDEYKANGNKFIASSKRGGRFPFKRRILPLITWFLGFAFTYSTISYLAAINLVDSTTFWTLLASFIIGCMWMLKRIEYESQARHLPPGSPTTPRIGSVNGRIGNKIGAQMNVVESMEHALCTNNNNNNNSSKSHLKCDSDKSSPPDN